MYKPNKRIQSSKIRYLSSVPINTHADICVKLFCTKEGSLLIERSVVSKIYTYQQSCGSTPESGGCLLGHFRPPHIHITDITTPMNGDGQSRTRFHRKDKKHLAAIKQFTKDTRTGTYLGEWHTHPEKSPSPSSIDKYNWDKILSMRQPINTIFLIVGTTDIATYSTE